MTFSPPNRPVVKSEAAVLMKTLLVLLGICSLLTSCASANRRLAKRLPIRCPLGYLACRRTLRRAGVRPNTMRG